MKQIVKIRRTETLEIELEVIQPLTVATLFSMFNTSQTLGCPGSGKVLAGKISNFEILSASPSCECQQPKPPGRKRSR